MQTKKLFQGIHSKQQAYNIDYRYYGLPVDRATTSTLRRCKIHLCQHRYCSRRSYQSFARYRRNFYLLFVHLLNERLKTRISRRKDDRKRKYNFLEKENRGGQHRLSDSTMIGSTRLLLEAQSAEICYFHFEVRIVLLLIRSYSA